jgi:hypothetical protein
MTLNPLNQKLLSPTSRIQSRQRPLVCKNPGTLRARLMKTLPAPTPQTCPRIFLPRSHRQPPQIACLPSPHPRCVIAQGLLSATTPKPVWRPFSASIHRVRPAPAPSENVVAIALRNTLPEALPTAATTSILAKFIRAALTCPEPKQQARRHCPPELISRGPRFASVIVSRRLKFMLALCSRPPTTPMATGEFPRKRIPPA